jgi:hypothetical protein
MNLTEMLIREKEKILNLIDARLGSYRSIITCEKQLDELINHPFNVNYYISEQRYQEHKDFFLEFLAHQSNNTYHPMTCGIKSSHDLLLPRLTEQGEHCYICPTCGYVQN